MSDLDKLMAKLKKPEEASEQQPVAEAPTETKVEKAPEVVPEAIPEVVEDDDEDDDTDDDEETPEASPKETEEEKIIHEAKADQNPIENEVAILQNDGVFRREMIIVKKEQVDVLKVIAQTLLDIKKKLTGEDGTK